MAIQQSPGRRRFQDRADVPDRPAAEERLRGETAENAEDALRRLGEEKPDLILMDVVMPGQNGFQLTRAITRDPQYADVPIIMCTSKNQETDRSGACARARATTSSSRSMPTS